MHEPESTTSSAEIQALRNEINQWALGIRCVFAALNVLPLYYCTRILLMVPKLETIYEDMLGSVQRIPHLTLVLLRHQPEVLALLWLLAGFSMVLIFVLKKAGHVWITAVVSVFALTATGHVAATLLLEPVISLVANLSGGTV